MDTLPKYKTNLNHLHLPVKPSMSKGAMLAAVAIMGAGMYIRHRAMKTLNIVEDNYIPVNHLYEDRSKSNRSSRSKR